MVDPWVEGRKEGSQEESISSSSSNIKKNHLRTSSNNSTSRCLQELTKRLVVDPVGRRKEGRKGKGWLNTTVEPRGQLIEVDKVDSGLKEGSRMNVYFSSFLD